MLAYVEAETASGYALGLWRIMFGVSLMHSAYHHFDNLIQVAQTTSFFFPLVEALPTVDVATMRMMVEVFKLAVVGFTLGVFFRPCAVVITVVHTYFFLLSKAAHNNHYYLISIVAALFIVTPADQNLALLPGGNAWCRQGNSSRAAAAGTLPRWCFVVHQWQIGLVYFFAGLAKVSDDWLEGRFMFKVCCCPRCRGSLPVRAELVSVRSRRRFRGLFAASCLGACVRLLHHSLASVERIRLTCCRSSQNALPWCRSISTSP